MRNSGHSWLFISVIGFFIASLIAANIISVKLIDVLGNSVPAGVIIFPLSYIFGDVLTEVYGYRQARRVIWLGFAANLLVVAAVWLAGIAPASGAFEAQQAYDRILGFTPRLLAASFLAYLVGEFTNSFVMSRLKVLTDGRLLWTRTILSTFVGEGLDTLIFISVAFGGVLPGDLILRLMLSQWTIKVAYEVLATPLTYLVVGFLKRREGIDTYDRNISFNPIAITD